MPQVIQIKRKFTGPGSPVTIAPGELCYNSTGQILGVGDNANTVQLLVGAARQVELTGAQDITGPKTFGGVVDIAIKGGAVGAVLQSADPVTGALAFGPAITASQQFVGSFDGTTGVVTFTTASGGTGPGLPAAAGGNNGWYVICDVEGPTPPTGAGAGVTGPFNIGDWIISNGTAWTHLNFGGISSVVASDVGVAPAVAGGSNVQDALEGLETADATFVVGPAAAINNNIAVYDLTTGKLIKDGGSSIGTLNTAIAAKADITYVDSENDAQDVLITANTAAIAALETNDAAQDTAIANKITKPGSVAAVGNIATYADLTGGLALDGGRTIAQLDAAIAAKGDVVGPTSAIDLNLAVFSTTSGKLIADGGQSIASIKTYVDGAIGAIPGAAPPLVQAPELSGDGTTGDAITFNGITAEAVIFSGKGLSTDPLMLLVVDGGTYT